MNRIALLVCAAFGATVCGAYAADLEYPKQAYDATYTQSGPQGSTTMRMMSDGKGHMRTETNAAGQKIVSISDYPNKVAYSIMETQKMVMKVPLKGGPQVHDTESAKKVNAKDLGIKVVNGHPSHGWEYTTEGGKVQTWVGEDTHCLVKSETTTSQGKISMDLKTYNAAAPGADMFQVPAGYKTMNIPTGM
jgi:hypothetical protein